jgi:hypothetical protein
MSIGISSMNIHSVTSLRLIPSTIQVNGETRHTCDIQVKDEYGNKFELTLFSNNSLNVALGREE